MDAELQPTAVIFHPDPERAERYRLLLQENGFVAMASASRGATLERIALYSPSIVITEMVTEDIPPQEWLRAIRSQSDAAVIIVTRQEERRTGLDRRLGAIFEYLEDNCSAEALIGAAKRATEFYRTMRKSINYARESRKRMLAQLEWLIWKQNQRVAEKRENGLHIIHSIKHSLTQGIGLGSMITQVHFLHMLARDNAVIGEQLAPLLESASFLTRWLENLDCVQSLLGERHQPGVIAPDDFEACVRRSVQAISELALIGGHSIEMQGLRPAFAVQGAERAIEVALSELMLNAMKFSPPGSTIHIAGHRMGNSFGLLVLSDVIDGTKSGIPPDLEQVIFEPFTKLSSVFDERYANRLPGLGLGLGLGLNLVQNALAQVGARAQVYQVSDHSQSSAPVQRVVAEILSPFVSQSSNGQLNAEYSGTSAAPSPKAAPQHARLERAAALRQS
ncbi:MAG: hypothetical protein K1X75_02605 [Leptospirales bacterium]|nr:hypothetical protein [Leptospirales bacterium]